MNFMDGLKRFLFGPSTSRQNDSNHDNSYPERFYERDEDSHNFPESHPEDFSRRSFDIFTDPLQMHQYFEHQMNEMLKNFGFQDSGGSFFRFNMPQIGEGSRGNPFLDAPPPDPGELRDQFLKQGYEKPTQSPKSDKGDKDIDDQVVMGDLDSIFGKNKQNQIVPSSPSRFGSTFYGHSVSTKIIRGADGSVETHSTVRDNEGNEETTIKRTLGDKEVSIIKKKDKYGKEEIIENLINVDESEKNKFFPFDKFFK